MLTWHDGNTAQCDRDMQYLRCEINALKEAHLQKAQSMADTIAHLQDTCDSLRHQLRQHNITEGKELCTT